MNIKLCECGCGRPAPIAKQTNRRIGHVKGQPIRYILGHVKYSGGTCKHQQGYRQTKVKGHHRADSRGYVFDHILIAEKALGKPLPPKAEIHHVNENRSDNRKENIIICQDRAYHKLIHYRMTALRECGHVNWRKCHICKQWDSIENLIVNTKTYHKECHRAYRRRFPKTG